MPGRMESVENLSRQQYRVRGAVDGFPPFHRPLEIATRFPQFHSPDDDDISPTNKKHKGTLLSSYRGGHFYWALTNLFAYLDTMRQIRQAILLGDLPGCLSLIRSRQEGGD